jgi:mono/diheme cytochrome c family protein
MLAVVLPPLERNRDRAYHAPVLHYRRSPRRSQRARPAADRGRRRFPGSNAATLFGWLLLFATGIGACSPAGQVPPGPTPVRTALPPVTDDNLPRYRSIAQRGEQVYSTLCVSCHGATGGGDGPAAAALKPRPTNFLDAEYMVDQRPDWYYHAITDGVVGSAMSGWDHQLDEATRWDVAYYVWSLGTASASRNAGAVDYTQRCASCHGVDGSAIATARLNDPRVAAISPRELRRRLVLRHPDLVPSAESAQTIQLADWLATFLYEPIDDSAP